MNCEKKFVNYKQMMNSNVYLVQHQIVGVGLRNVYNELKRFLVMEIELQNFFDELDLRIEESEHTLNEIERVIFTKRYRLNTEHLAIFSVQTIAMIYSIWEGFIQKTFSEYLSTLNKLNIPFQD